MKDDGGMLVPHERTSQRDDDSLAPLLDKGQKDDGASEKRSDDRNEHSDRTRTIMDDPAADEGDDDDVIVVISNLTADMDRGSQKFSLQTFLMHLGPGFLMCIAFIDPGNLEADLQTGSQTGYTLLWVLLWSTMMGFLLQSCSSRLGVATGQHLAQHCRRHFSPALRILLWIMAELAIIGSDVQEVIGTALALSILSRGLVPLWAGAVAAAVTAYLILLVEKLGSHILEYFFQIAIAVMVVCMGAVFFLADVPYGEVAKGLVIPSLPSSSVPLAAGLLGSIIMPHNLYLHSALVHSRPLRELARRPTIQESIYYYNMEGLLALFVTLFINVAVISVFAKGFYGHHGDIGIQNAGTYLGKRFGRHVEFIWAIGLLSSGQLSTITGTFAGQHVMSGFFRLKLSPMSRSLITRAVALIPTLLVALSAPSDSTRLDTLNQAINILQSIQLPFVIIPLLAFTSAPAVMGIGFVSSFTHSAILWTIAASIIGINMGTAYQTAIDLLDMYPFLYVAFLATVVSYAVLVLWTFVAAMRLKWHLPDERQMSEAEARLEDPILNDSVLN